MNSFFSVLSFIIFFTHDFSAGGATDHWPLSTNHSSKSVMTIAQTNLINYNILVRIPATNGMSGDIKWALMHKTCAVRGASDPSLDGVWSGVLSVSGFRQSLGSINEGNIVFPAVVLKAARGDADAVSDELIDEIRSCEYLVGAPVEFYWTDADAPNPGADNLFHVGIVERGDVRIETAVLEIACRDRMERDDRRIPATHYLDQNSIDESARGRSVPILFGDWSAENSDYWIPATCVNTKNTGDNNLAARICRPGEYGIKSFGYKARWLDAEGRYKRDETGYRELDLLVTDASEGNVELVGSSANAMERSWESGDRIWIKGPQGEVDESGTLISNPVGVIRHLLLDMRVGLGLAPVDLDEDSFDRVRGTLDEFGYRCRRFIDEETTVLDVISEICCEFGLKLIVRAGRYALVGLGFANVEEPDHSLRFDNVLSFREWNDRNRVGFEKIDLRYRMRPKDRVLTRRYTHDEDAATKSQANLIEAQWIFDDETAVIRASVWAFCYGGVIKTLSLETDFGSLGVRIGQFVEVIRDDAREIYQVTQLDYNFDLPIRLTMELTALSHSRRTGVWSADEGQEVPSEFGGGVMPASWDEADDRQRSGLSFWSDDAGENPDGSDAKVWGR